MPCLYEIIFEDRKEKGLKPYKYSGSNYTDNENYLGSSTHKDYKDHRNESRESGRLKKNIIKEWTKEEISIIELRKFESDWQKEEKHKYDESYYNLCDWTHPIMDDEIKKKISETLKRKGACPYNKALTHSKETIAKRKKSRESKKHQWWYNPETLEHKFIPTAIEKIPDGWKRGKKPKKQRIYSDRTKACNLAYWEIYKNDELFWKGENLSEWCESQPILDEYGEKNRLGGLKFNTSGITKVLSKITRVELAYSDNNTRGNNTIIENNVDTLLNASSYAKRIGRSGSYVCGSLKRGFYETKEYDLFTVKKINKV